MLTTPPKLNGIMDKINSDGWLATDDCTYIQRHRHFDGGYKMTGFVSEGTQTKKRMYLETTKDVDTVNKYACFRVSKQRRKYAPSIIDKCVLNNPILQW